MSNRHNTPLLLGDSTKAAHNYSAVNVSGTHKLPETVAPRKNKSRLSRCAVVFLCVLSLIVVVTAAAFLLVFCTSAIQQLTPKSDAIVLIANSSSFITNLTNVDVNSTSTFVDDDDQLTADEQNDTLIFSNALLKTPQKRLLKSSAQKTVTVDTPVGKVQGVLMESRQGRKYNAFLKIPYAKPPTGKRRFKAPQAITGWSGTFDGTKKPSVCIQKVKYSTIDEATGDEDCLYMSIYTPILPSSKDFNASELLPVMFYIHGGGFTDGNGIRYGAKYFMDENVVLITFQYRLAAFGFLNTNDGDILGNMGLKDQVEALKFVKKIIESFSGDPDRITIFGNSAGAVSVANHLVSPLSSGLFARGIAQSGNAVNTMGGGDIDPYPEKTAEIYAKKFNCSYRASTAEFSSFPRRERLSKCLRNVDAADIAIVRTLETRYSVTIEKQSKEAFMVDYPINLMRQGKVNSAQFITGVNSGEQVRETIEVLKSPVLTKALNEHWAFLAPKLFLFNSSAIDPDAMANRVRDFYFGKSPISNETEKNLTALFNDRQMIHATKVGATYHAKLNPTYLYYLTKRPAKSYADKALEGFPPGDHGVSHADELQYMFLYDGYPEINATSPWYDISIAFVKLWSTFGATGSPGENWLPFKPKEQELWYNMDDQRVMTDVLVERMKLWDSYPARDLGYE